MAMSKEKVIRRKTLIRYVVPTVLSSCCFFLFTIIDGIFVGNGVGTDALGAVNLVMPFVMVVNALFMLATIGGVTVAAIRFGRGDEDGANQAFMHSIISIALIAIVLTAVGTLLTDQISRLLGANDTFHQLVKDYLFWYSVFIIPSGLSSALQRFCRNDGDPILVSVAVIIGTACNIFGDWLTVFPLRMGLKGAAIATGVSQTVTLLIVLIHFINKKGRLRIISLSQFKPDGALFKKIAMRGLPETVAQFATPVATLCMNYVLLERIGNIAVNAYSIICYVASFAVAIFFGSAEGLQPLFGQSYGAREDGDLKYYFKSGVVINFVGSCLITVLLYFVGGGICKMFGADSETLAFTIKYMPQYSWGFIFMSLNTIASAYLYSTKRTREALILNVLHSFIFNSTAIIILPMIFGNGIIWSTFGIYEIMVMIAAIILIRRSERNGIVYK